MAVWCHVSACSACAHKVEQGVEPDMRMVEVNGAPVRYVNTGLAPAYWGGYGFGPGLFTGFVLGEALASHAIVADDYSAGDSASSGGEYGGGDFGGGDFGSLGELLVAANRAQPIAKSAGGPDELEACEEAEGRRAM